MSMAHDAKEMIFAVLYVLTMGLTHCYKTVFYMDFIICPVLVMHWAEENNEVAFMSHLLWHFGLTCALHLYIIVKILIDFS